MRNKIAKFLYSNVTTFSSGITRMMGGTWRTSIIRLAVLTQHQRVTDGQTDRGTKWWTNLDSIVHIVVVSSRSQHGSLRGSEWVERWRVHTQMSAWAEWDLVEPFVRWTTRWMFPDDLELRDKSEWHQTFCSPAIFSVRIAPAKMLNIHNNAEEFTSYIANVCETGVHCMCLKNYPTLKRYSSKL